MRLSLLANLGCATSRLAGCGVSAQRGAKDTGVHGQTEVERFQSSNKNQVGYGRLYHRQSTQSTDRNCGPASSQVATRRKSNKKQGRLYHSTSQHSSSIALFVRGQTSGMSRRIRDAIFARTGCRASVGVAKNRLLARRERQRR